MFAFLKRIFTPKPKLPLKTASCGCVVKIDKVNGDKVIKTCADAKWIFDRRKNCINHEMTHSAKMYTGELNTHYSKAIEEVKYK